MSLLSQQARAFGLELTPSQEEAFERYYHLLVEWNRRFNLTALTAYTDVVIKHFLDSLSAAPLLTARGVAGKALVDIGTGAGFPGAPLAIAFPELRVTLLEATGKKVLFLEELARTLGLANVTAIKARAEELAHHPRYREQYDFATARAVAPMRTLVEYSLPFVRVGGLFIAYKAVEAEEETRAAQSGIERLGGRVREIIPVKLADLADVRHLVVVDKITLTPPLFPRQRGLPVKKPL